jgi:hypothetical protein
MGKIPIFNFFVSVFILILVLLSHSFRNQMLPTPDSNLEAFYNLFIKDNTLLPICLVYLISSVIFIFFVNIRFRKSK